MDIRIKKPHLKIDWKPRLYKLSHQLARTSLPEILFLGTFILSRYQTNIDFSYPAELVIPFVAFALLGTVVYYALRLAIRSVLAAHLAAIPLSYLLYNFEFTIGNLGKFTQVLVPDGLETNFTTAVVVTLLLGVVLGGVGYLLARVIRWHKLQSLQLPKAMMFFIVFLFVSQAAKVGFRLVEIRNELSYQYATKIPERNPSKTVTKPDIYYFVFDRYASDTTLKNIYGFDNSSMTEYLDSQGFVSRPDAYANYPFTMSSVGSTLAMEYHTQLGALFGQNGFQTGFPYRSILNEPPVAKILAADGYKFNQVSSWWDFTRVTVKADVNRTKSYRLNIFGEHFYLSDLERDIFYKSFFSPLLKKGLTVGHTPIVTYDHDRNPRQNLDVQLSYLETLASNKHAQPQFTFAHILAPHPPYVFNADGSDTTYDNGPNDHGIDEKEKYINELQYVNTRMRELIGTIRAKSPNAVIVIQADEGPYPKEFRFELAPGRNYNPKDLKLPQAKQKYGIIASYYLPGVDKAEVAKNINASVNPFRFILSNYLGYKLEMLPDCQFYSGNKFNVYTYEIANQVLTGTPNPAQCNQYK